MGTLIPRRTINMSFFVIFLSIFDVENDLDNYFCIPSTRHVFGLSNVIRCRMSIENRKIEARYARIVIYFIQKINGLILSYSTLLV